MENYAEKFAKRLRDTLGSERTQADLIKLMAENGFEMTGGRLSHYMQGRNYPDPPILAELAKALGVSADYLLLLTDEQLPVEDLSEQLANTKGEGKIERLMAAMTKEQRQQVISYAEYLLMQAGRADEIERGSRAAFQAVVNVLHRQHPGQLHPILEALADAVPELRKLVGPPPKDKSVGSG